MSVKRLPTVPTGFLNRLINFPFFFSPTWIWAILSQARNWRAHAILVEDLPLAPTALWAGKILKIPVLYDMGEVYPEFLRGLLEFKELTLVDRLMRNPKPAELIERMVLRNASFTFVVSEESRDRALERGAHPSRIAIVGNTPEAPEALLIPADLPPELEQVRGRPVVLFVGILISDRGMSVAIRAMDTLRERMPEVVMVVVGDGIERPHMEREIEERGVRDHVLLVGWKDPEELPGFYQHAAVGVLPFLDGGQIRYTLANKLFDYLGAGLPVAASDVPPMRRVLTECGAGVLVQAGDAGALAEGLEGLLKTDPRQREEMSEAGKAIVRTKYRWHFDAQRLVEGVESVLSERIQR